MYKRCGAPAKFAARIVLGAVLPGSPVDVDLLGKDPSQRYRFIVDKAAREVADELDV